MTAGRMLCYRLSIAAVFTMHRNMVGKHPTSRSRMNEGDEVDRGTHMMQRSGSALIAQQPSREHHVI